MTKVTFVGGCADGLQKQMEEPLPDRYEVNKDTYLLPRFVPICIGFQVYVAVTTNNEPLPPNGPMKPKQIFRVEVQSSWSGDWKLLKKELISEADAQWLVRYYQLIKLRSARYSKIDLSEPAP